MIPTRVHGVIDYVVGLLLIAAPWLFGFADVQNAMLVPVILGIAALLYSLMTQYELGALRVIPMPVHLMLDAGSGLLLLLSPWLFGFADVIVWPHVVFGILEIGVALMTQRHSTVETRHGHQPARV
jgi:hypothetical protein